MKVTKNVENSLPIEILQKGFIISEEEIKSNPVLKLTVNKYNFLTNNILYRKQKEIFSQIKLIQ